MQATIKTVKFSYENRISYAERKRMVEFYRLGYTVSAIARASGVKAPSVLHHIRVQGAYDPKREITKWNKQIPQKIYFTKFFLRYPSNPYAGLPEDIQQIYKRMHEEDIEMAQRIPTRRSKRHVPHKSILADRHDKFDRVPFKAMITIVL